MLYAIKFNNTNYDPNMCSPDFFLQEVLVLCYIYKRYKLEGALSLFCHHRDLKKRESLFSACSLPFL